MSQLNEQLFDFLFRIGHANALTESIVVFFAEYLPYLLLIWCVWFLFVSHKDWRARLTLLGEGILVLIFARGVVVSIIHYFYPTPRPYLVLGLEPLVIASSSSFPSSHATILFAIGVTLFYFRKRLGLLFLGAAFLNALARVASGVHWPIDIIGGAGLGIIVGIIVHAMLVPSWVKLLERERST